MATIFVRGRLVLAALATAVLTLGLTANAQEAGEEADDAPIIEELVVTATYRDTRLMDTPIAISAVTDVDIVQKGIDDIHTLYQQIPGFNYKSSTSGYNILSIRGITPFGGGPSPVGAYLDNVPMGSPRGDSGHLKGVLFDMQRVEVLKGPQGTLYGEGSMGGNIRYITKQPDPSGFDYSFRSNMEDMSHSGGIGHRIDGMVNVPLGERAAARLVLYTRDQKGLIDVPGLRNQADVNWTKDIGGRLTVAVQATDTLRLSAMGMIVNTDIGGPGIAFHCYEEVRADIGINEIPDYPSPGVDCTGDHNAQFGRDPYITHKTHPHMGCVDRADNPRRCPRGGGGVDTGYDDYGLYNLSVEWELPFADLIGSASYHERDSRRGNEETNPSFAFMKNVVERDNCFGALPDGVCGVPHRYSSQTGINYGHPFLDRYSYELRLVSNTDSRWQWTAGAYYRKDDHKSMDHSACPFDLVYQHVIPQEPCVFIWLFHPDTPLEHQAMIAHWLNTVIFPGNRSVSLTEDESIFGEVSYRIGDQWEITAGARYADVRVKVDTFERGINPTHAIASSFDLDDDTKTSPKVTLTWRPQEDLMIYGTWSHGFRPGVVQSRLSGIVAQLDDIRADNPRAQQLWEQLVDAQTVDGDEAISYELGLKATLADGRVDLTASLYYIDWKNIVVRTSAATPDIEGLVPIALSYDDNAGAAESKGVELEMRATLSESLSFALGASFMPVADIGTAGTGNLLFVEEVTAPGTFPGNRIPASPKYSGNASLVYDFELAGYDATARVDAYVVAEQFRGGSNERATPGYETVDVKLYMGRDNYQFGVYVRNLFDGVIAFERNQQGYVFGRARTLGLEVNYNL